MSAPATDPTEELLAAALADARTDARWAIPAKAHTPTAVRRAATRQRTRNAGLALASLAAVGVGSAAATGAFGTSPNHAGLQYGNGATPAPSPVRGITPAWIPTSGADWVLVTKGYDAFVASHRLPSPAPHDVQSPGPLTEYSAQLEREVQAALPAGATTVRADAVDGRAGTAAVHAKLADGTQVEVQRIPLQQPIPDRYNGQEQASMSRRDLATGSVLVTITGAGYFAFTVTPGGVQTSWYAPESVPLTTLAAWAEAADHG
ncbi:MAG: hypothetical protein JWO88_2697 [Frankiales bacterium]|nr:hypothetical protein [Frankiales bacterium]